MRAETLLLVHAAATWFMTGVIWFVQLVHYPLFAGVGRDGFTAYAAAHSRRTTWVVFPPMTIELITGVALALAPPAGVGRALPLLGAALIAALWLSTALLQVPKHRVLSGGFDAAAHLALVRGNALRTVVWSMRGLLVLWMIARH